MASKGPIEADRKNAKRRARPKSPVGKARPSRNSVGHRRSRSDLSDDAQLQSSKFAGVIMAGLEHRGTSEAVMKAALSKFQIFPLRDVRPAMFAALLECPEPRLGKGLKGYQRVALAKQKRTPIHAETKNASDPSVD